MEYLSADGVLTGLQIVCGLSADGVTVLITLRPHFNMSSTKFLHFTFHLQTLRCDDIARSRIFKAWKHSKCIHHNKYFECYLYERLLHSSYEPRSRVTTRHITPSSPKHNHSILTRNGTGQYLVRGFCMVLCRTLILNTFISKTKHTFRGTNCI